MTWTRREPAQLELLISSGAHPSGPAGVLLPTASGTVHVDVIEVTDADLSEPPEDPTERLYVLSDAWAVATASPVLTRAKDVPDVVVPTAEPGPLVAMKLQSLMNRGSAKEATDLLDVIRLCLDPVVGPVVLAQLGNADEQLRPDAALHAERWFDRNADRSFRLVRGIPEGRDTERDDLRLVAGLLLSALASDGRPSG